MLGYGNTDWQTVHSELAALRTVWETNAEGKGTHPARADVDVLELWPWLGHLALVEVIDGGADFRCRLHGTAMVEILGMDVELPAGFRRNRGRFTAA